MYDPFSPLDYDALPRRIVRSRLQLFIKDGEESGKGKTRLRGGGHDEEMMVVDSEEAARRLIKSDQFIKEVRIWLIKIGQTTINIDQTPLRCYTRTTMTEDSQIFSWEEMTSSDRFPFDIPPSERLRR